MEGNENDLDSRMDVDSEDTDDNNQGQQNGEQQQHGASNILPEGGHQHQPKDDTQDSQPCSMEHDQEQQPAANDVQKDQKDGVLDKATGQQNGGQQQHGASNILPEGGHQHQHQPKDDAQDSPPCSMEHDQDQQPAVSEVQKDQKDGVLDKTTGQQNGGQQQHGASNILPEGGHQHQPKDDAQDSPPCSMEHYQDQQPTASKFSDVPSQEQTGGPLYSQHAHSQEPEQLQAPQMTAQQYRSLQASKQMLYDVYSQTIAMLEEFEAFDKGMGAKQDKIKLERSQIKRPDQSQKTKHDVQAIVEAELACLQAQLRFCPPEVREQTRDELVEKTLGWVAVREEMGVGRGLTDSYVSQVLEILLTGVTQLRVDTKREKTTGPAGKEAVLSSFRAVMMGQHYGAEQDKQFHEDPNKKAQCPKIRSARRTLPRMQSANRVIEMNSRLSEYLKEHDLR